MSKKPWLGIISGVICAVTIFTLAGSVAYAAESSSSKGASDKNSSSTQTSSSSSSSSSSTGSTDSSASNSTESNSTGDSNTSGTGDSSPVKHDIEKDYTKEITLSFTDLTKVTEEEIIKYFKEKHSDKLEGYEDLKLVTKISEIESMKPGTHTIEFTATDKDKKIVLIKVSYLVPGAIETKYDIVKDFRNSGPIIVIPYGENVNLTFFTDYLKQNFLEEVADFKEYAFVGDKPNMKKAGIQEFSISAKAADDKLVQILMKINVLPERPNLAFTNVTYDPETRILSGYLMKGTYANGDVTPSNTPAAGFEITVREADTTVDLAKILATCVTAADGKFSCDLSKVTGIDLLEIVSLSAISTDYLEYTGEVKFSLAKKNILSSQPPASSTPAGNLPQTGDQDSSVLQLMLGFCMVASATAIYYLLRRKKA